ncbi:hypothetical protein KA093_00655 [Candidatus Saccharibacteria bacterium]|nr:hypothetical protein [Candidatus Saccharibacteria bacterium]
MIRRYIVAFVMGLVVAGAGSALVPHTAGAVASPITDACKVDSTSPLCSDQSDKLFGPDSIWTKIVNTLIYVTGAIAVIMMVIGGMRFTLSGGDASGTKSARETIIYAAVGLVVAMMSYAIVNFVLSRI